MKKKISILYIYMNVLFYYTDIFTFTKILFEQGFDTMCRKGWPYRYIWPQLIVKIFLL